MLMLMTGPNCCCVYRLRVRFASHKKDMPGMTMSCSREEITMTVLFSRYILQSGPQDQES